MARDLGLSEAEILAAFADALGVDAILDAPGPEWLSATEIIERLGLRPSTGARMLQAALTAGRVERRRGRSSSGRVVWLYRVVGAGPEAGQPD